MFGQFSKKTLFSKFISGVIAVSFILASVPVSSYAGVDKLRPPSISGVGDIASELELGAGPFVSASGAKIATANFQISGLSDLSLVIANKSIKQAVVGLDWNTPLAKNGKVDDREKIENTVDTIKWFKESGLQYVFGLSHLGREGASLKPVIDEARKVLEEEGLSDIEMVLLPENFAEAKKVIDEKKAETALSGKKVWFMLENIRKYKGEQSKNPAEREEFEKEIIALTGEASDNLVYIFEAFEKAHRAEEASIEMGFLLFPRDHIAAGINTTETVRIVAEFSGNITGKLAVVAGGKKFDKLKNVLGDLGKVVAKSKGEMFIIGALADPLLVNKGVNVGKSLMPKKEEDLKGVKDGIKKLVENVRDNGLKVSLPVDFVVKDGKNVIDVLGDEDAQIDIGPKTIKKIADYINSLKKGDGLLLNGGAGVFDEEWGSAEGTFAVITAANEAAKRGVAVFFGGGDMVNAAKKWEETTGQKLDSSVLKSTAGGALFVAIGKGIGGGLIPVRALMKFPGDAKEKLLNVYSAVIKAFPGAMILPVSRTSYKDTSVGGADETREPALDLSKGADKDHVIKVPDGRNADRIKNFYDTSFLPVVITAEDIENLMPAIDRKALFEAKDEKGVSKFAQELLKKALADKGVPVQAWSERSHSLDQWKLGEVGVDLSSVIAIRTLHNDLFVWVPIVVKRGEEAAYSALAKKTIEGIAQKNTEIPEVSFELPEELVIADHNSAYQALKKYNPLFFGLLQKKDLSRVNVLIDIVNKLDPRAMVDPGLYGIQLNKEMGVFTSSKDMDGKAAAPGFGKNLELFRAGLYSAGISSQRIYHLAAPNYDAQGEASVAVNNKEFQDAVIGFYARIERHLLSTAINYFKDAGVFESLRSEVGDYAQRFNKAVREANALELSQANAGSLIQHLTDNGVILSENEKRNVINYFAKLETEGNRGFFDILQLAGYLTVDNFTKSFRLIKFDHPRTVLPSDKPYEAYDGSGRIARTQFAQRLGADISAGEEKYISRFMIASQEIKGKTFEEKSAAAVKKVIEMLSDRQIKDANIVVRISQEKGLLHDLIESGRLTFSAEEKVLSAQLDFQDTDLIPSTYAVRINLDGVLKGVAYCVDVAEFHSGLKTALEARNRKLDNLPRPFIVRAENNEEIFFGLRVDATPGGVEIGDQELEAAGGKGTVKLGGDTLWKLFAKFNLAEPKGDQLTASSELERIRQIYAQVEATRMPVAGGKKLTYIKSQVPAAMLLPGFGSLGRHLGWAIPYMGGSDVMYVHPGSCSTNGDAHIQSALIAFSGNAEVVGPTYHMNTSSDKVVEKNPLGHFALKSTGAAKGVKLLVSLEEGSQTFFTSVRTPIGLVKGKADIVGGSMFDLLVRLPVNVPDELVVRYLSRIAAEFPEDLKLFNSADGSYTWKDTIAGQKTGSIIYSDFVERVAPGIYRFKAAYDNEMSFGSKENALHEAVYLDALRSRQTVMMAEILSESLANTADAKTDVEEAAKKMKESDQEFGSKN